MAVSLESLQQQLEQLRHEVDHLRELLIETDELSEEARAAVYAARATPESEYVDLE